MATVALTKDTFDQAVEENDTVIVDFWAAWCGPCRTFAPIFDRASEKYDDIVFAKVDTDAEQELAMAFGIRSIPTLMVFRDQIVLYAQPGALPDHVFEDLIGQVRALDMEQVRATIAEHEGHDHGHDHGHGDGHHHDHEEQSHVTEDHEEQSQVTESQSGLR